MVSDYFSESEEDILKNYINLRCKNCKFIFKGIWPSNLFWRNVYKKLIPIHPKGWDKFSNDFSKNKLQQHCKNLLKKKKQRGKELLKRKILSILNAANVKLKDKSKFIEFKKNVRNESLDLIKKKYKFISQNLNEAKNFSRFKGFGNTYLLKVIEEKIGTIKSIAEVGCPLWGFLDIQNIEKKYFLKLDPHVFWGESCVKNNKKCYEKLHDDISVIEIEKFFRKKIKVDLFVAFLVLDHLVNPVQLFEKMLKTSKAVAIILEDPTDLDRKGIAIQHFSAWTKSFFLKFSKKYNMKVLTGIKDLESQGNNFFLLY